MSGTDNKTNFVVILKTEKTVTCDYCGGACSVEMKEYHNQYRTVICPICCGKGKVTRTTKTEVKLKDALEQMGYEPKRIKT